MTDPIKYRIRILLSLISASKLARWWRRSGKQQREGPLSIIKQILAQSAIRSKPPVLIDVGASGELHSKWKFLAPHSICVAFDPDSREMSHVNSSELGYKKVHTIPAIVSDQNSGAVDFHLTEFPYCSSVLKPDSRSLSNWLYRDYFNVSGCRKFPSVTLSKALEDLNLNYADWLKIDAQGLDLAVLKGLDCRYFRDLKVIELEPGLVDAYLGEDKLDRVLKFMDDKAFWLFEFQINGMPRVPASVREDLTDHFSIQFLDRALTKAPGWMSVGYINNFLETDSKRDLLLGLAILIEINQLASALEIAKRGRETFGDPIFSVSFDWIIKKIRNRRYWSSINRAVSKARGFYKHL